MKMDEEKLYMGTPKRNAKTQMAFFIIENGLSPALVELRKWIQEDTNGTFE